MDFKRFFLILCILGMPNFLYAQVIPGSADAGRIKPEQKEPAFDHSKDKLVAAPSGVQNSPRPKDAKSIRFTLREVHIEGVTVYKPSEFSDIYTQYVNKEISLDIAYDIADKITQRYRNAGYFLSLAYIPPQHIKSGKLVIKVVEGAVGKVELENVINKNYVVQGFIKHLLAQKPLKADTLESFLLRLNDLPGFTFRAVLSPLEKAPEGVVKLTLVPSKKDGRGAISFDNFGSRYLGPNELSASYSTSLIQLQQTTISGLTSIPVDSLHYMTLEHTAVIAPNITLGITGGITKAHPAYTLTPEDIKSTSNYLGVNFAWQWIRQRQENLSLKLTLDGRDTSSDILGTPLTRDYVRALRAGASYDLSDKWLGYNIVNFTFSHGVDILGSSKAGNANLSNPGATPDFSKAEFSFSRQQTIANNWLLVMAGSSQFSSGPLYSSEQFGYGGQVFGRAYDASEILGDDGVNGSLELDYNGIHKWESVNIIPYTFYDIGTVWGRSNLTSRHESGSSAGFGIKAASLVGSSGNLGVAWPLTRAVSTPIYDSNKQGPRIQLQVSQGF
jgi:hemolysin activation/secretion protein